LRVVARKNILALHYPHTRAVDQRVGLHYRRFRGNVCPADKENLPLCDEIAARKNEAVSGGLRQNPAGSSELSSIRHAEIGKYIAETRLDLLSAFT
jgi:hypothetical protein